MSTLAKSTHARSAHRRNTTLARKKRKNKAMPAPSSSLLPELPPPGDHPRLSPRVAAACGDLTAGLEAVAKHAPNLAPEVSLLIASFASTGARRGSRLRWEWLASTGSVMEGSPDARLLAECASLADRILVDLARQSAPDESVRQAAIRVHLLVARNVPAQLLGLSLST